MLFLWFRKKPLRLSSLSAALTQLKWKVVFSFDLQTSRDLGECIRFAQQKEVNEGDRKVLDLCWVRAERIRSCVVFTVTCLGVKWFEKSNRLQLLVGLRWSKRILFDHPLLTVTNVHINTHRGAVIAKSRCSPEDRNNVHLSSKKNPQTACIIAHQLTMPPFIVSGKTRTWTHACLQKLAGCRRLSRPLRRRISEQTV